jgi:hypothetical protein
LFTSSKTALLILPVGVGVWAAVGEVVGALLMGLSFDEELGAADGKKISIIVSGIVTDKNIHCRRVSPYGLQKTRRKCAFNNGYNSRSNMSSLLEIFPVHISCQGERSASTVDNCDTDAFNARLMRILDSVVVSIFKYNTSDTT